MITKIQKSNNNNQEIYINNSSNINNDINSNKNNLNKNNSNNNLILSTSEAFKFCKNIKEINKQNEKGYTPIYSSILSENIPALSDLLSLGADPNIPNFAGETPLHLCVNKKNIDSLIILLKYNSDCNIQTKKGNTPLHLAIQNNLENYIQILLRNSANPNIKNKIYGQTPTHLAVINRLDEELLKLLKENNADMFYIKDKYNKTPFDYAKDNNDEYYIQLLIKIFGKNNKYIDKQIQTWNEKLIPKNLKKMQNYSYSNSNDNYKKNNNKLYNSDIYKYNFNLDNTYNQQNKISNNQINKFLKTNSNKNNIKFEDNNSYNSSYKINIDNQNSDKNIYTHGRAIISSDLCSNNIQIKELNYSSECNSMKSKKSLNEFLENEINNIDINSYKPNYEEIKDNKENININNNNNKISHIYSIKSETSNNSELSKNKNIRNSENSINNNSINLYNNINFSHSSSQNLTNKSNISNNTQNTHNTQNTQNLYQSNSINANRKIIKSIINDTVKKILIKSFSSDGDNDANPNLLSKDSKDISQNNIEQIQINEQININQNNTNNTNNNISIDKNNDKFNIETNNFTDNNVNLYENGTTSFVLYKSKNSNELNNNNIMINNLNNNENKSVNISNIYDEININTNTNKSNTNDFIVDNNINRNKTINLNNINYINKDNNINNSNNKTNNMNINEKTINSINNSDNKDLKDNIFLNSTNSHIFSELNMNSNTNNYNLTNNISLSYSKNLDGEDEFENNINNKKPKNSEEKLINEYNINTRTKKIFSNLDINLSEQNDVFEEKSDISNDNFDNNKINKSIYKNNNNYKNSLSSNTFHGSNCTIKKVINDNNSNSNNNNINHQKKISNGKVTTNLNQNKEIKEISSSIILKKSKSFMDSPSQKKNNFNNCTYSSAELEKNNTNKNNRTNIYQKHHRQLSYHLNYKSCINNNKEKELQKNINKINTDNKENKENNQNVNTNNNNNISVSKNELIYNNKNSIINPVNSNSSIKNSKKKIIQNLKNNNNVISKKYLIKNKSYQNFDGQPIESGSKEFSFSPINKSIRSTNNISNTVKHNNISNNNNNNESNLNQNLNINNQNKKNRISFVANTTNNTAFSTINRQKNYISSRQSKFTNNNKNSIPFNNKYNTNNYYNDEYDDDFDEEYCDSNKLKSIPTNILIRLRDWLISCDLLCYYNLFIVKNMYNIDSYIHALQEGTIAIHYKDIEKIGIKKPGHIFRILIRLEIDSGIIDNNLFDYILEKINYCSHTTTLALTSSINDINCCGINICSNGNNNIKNGNNRKGIKNNEIYFNDLSSFLKAYNLYKFKGNFIYNGFDKIEYIFIQLFSKYTFNKRILNDYLHVYIEKDKIKILNKLYMIKLNIAKELGIEIDEEELNKNIFSQNKGNKYSEKNKNKKNNYNSDYSSISIKKSLSNYYLNNSSSIQKSSSNFNNTNNQRNNKDNETNNYCIIF